MTRHYKLIQMFIMLSLF